MFAKSDRDDITGCNLLYDDPADFSGRTFKEFWKLLTWLYEAGSSGKTWAQIYQDGKLFHPVHTFEVLRVDRTGKTHRRKVDVFQFKKRKADIRILICQSDIGQLNVFLSHAFEKDSQATPPSEQARAEANIREFLDERDGGKLQLVRTQGGKAVTPSFT